MSIYDYIKEKEGFHDTVYDDAVGVKTIGYGRTGGSFEPTTREAEDEWLKKRVDSDRRYVQNYAKDHGYNWSPEQVNALSSFVFNLGRGRLDQLTQGGKRDDATIGQKIQLYNKAGGRELPGLVTRRNEESAMFSGNPGGVPQSTFQSPHTDGPSAQPIPPRVLDEPTFDEAFAQARQTQGAGGEFEWDGNFYTTNYKEEDMQGLFDGTPMVQYLRRGSTVVLDEEEKKRREEARAAGANNTSGGRNVGRTPPAYQDDIVPGLNEPILNDPNNRNPFITGEEPVLRTEQQSGLVPEIDQGGVPVVDNTSATVPPVVAGRADVPVGALPAGETAADPTIHPTIGQAYADMNENMLSWLINSGNAIEADAARNEMIRRAGEKTAATTADLQEKVNEGTATDRDITHAENVEEASNFWTNVDVQAEEALAEEEAMKAEALRIEQEKAAAAQAEKEQRLTNLGVELPPETELPDARDDAKVPEVNELPTPQGGSGRGGPTELAKYGDQAIVNEITNEDGSKVTTLANGQTVTTAPDGSISVGDGKGGEGNWFSSDQAKKVGQVIKDYLGLEGQDVKRAIGMYLLSRATGASHAGSMQWAGQQVYDSAAARDKSETKHFQDLVEKGEYTTASLKAYKESGYDPSVLILKEQAGNFTELGNTETFYAPGGRRVQAREVEDAAGNKIWLYDGDKPVNLNTFHKDPKRVQGTAEYEDHRNSQISIITKDLEALQADFDTFSTKEGDKKYTAITSRTEARKVVDWALKANIPPEGMGQLMENAYEQAIAESKDGEVKAKSLVPYLNQQYVETQIGDTVLFTDKNGDAASAEKVGPLIDAIANRANLEGSRIVNSTKIIQTYRPQWNDLSEEQKKDYNKRAIAGESGFMKFLQDKLEADVAT